MSKKRKLRELKPKNTSQLSAVTDQQIKEFFSINFKWLSKDKDLKEVKGNKKYSKQFLNWIEKMSQLEWQQIISSSRKFQGFETINRSSLKSSIPQELNSETIISFHWWENRSIVGVRRDGVFCPFSVELDTAHNKNYNH